MPNIQRISKERFNAYMLWIKHPIANLILTEIEWYEINTEHSEYLGVVFIDKTDMDYGFTLLGRVKGEFFDVISIEHSMEDLETSRSKCISTLIDIATQSEADHPPMVDDQTKTKGKKKNLDIFTPVVPPEKQHPYYH